jgi:6-phosphogluconolactonase (cycloisomerase 2 family)
MNQRLPLTGFGIVVLVLAAALASCSGSKPSTYTLSGLVSGLSGSGLELQINSNTVPITTNGPVTIESGFHDGTAYIITVKSQPTNPSQTCVVGNPADTFGAGSISNVTIECTTNYYTLGGTVSGLSGSTVGTASLTLANDGVNAASIAANGAFTLKQAVASGSAYAITVARAPTNPAASCTVTNGTGTVGAANITNVSIVCVPVSFAVGGTVSGLTGTGLVLTNGSDSVTVNANGSFAFPTVVASGATYSATITTQPTSIPQQNCLFLEASANGLVGAGAVTSISIKCTNVGRFLYVTNSANNTIAAYSIDPVAGGLTPVAGSPYATGSDPISLALSPFGGYAYVLDGDGTISQYRINSASGVLTAIAGSPYSLNAPSTTSSLVIGPSDAFAYISEDSSRSEGLSVFNINQPNGVLSPIADGALTGFGTSLLFSPSGQYAYGVLTTSTTTGIGFSDVNATTGLVAQPTAIKLPAPNVPSYLAFSPDGTYLYAAGPASLLLAYRVNPASGAYQAASGSPFAKTGDPGNVQGLTLDPGASFAYLTDCQCLKGFSAPGEILAYALTAGAYAVTPVLGEPFTAGLSPGQLVFDPSGKFAYAGNAVSIDVSGYSLNASNGVLSPITGSPFSVGTQTGTAATISLAILR